MVNFNNMKNKKLEEILENYKNKSNKELATVLVTLEQDFNSIKSVLLELTETVGEIETVYDSVFEEMEKRLNIKK